MQNANMIMSIFVFYGQKKGIPSENPFLFRKELLLNMKKKKYHQKTNILTLLYLRYIIYISNALANATRRLIG